MRKSFIDQPVQWYKDNKLLIGFIIIILSFVIGIYGKVLIFAKLYQPIELVTGISIYVFSWILTFVGAFIVGWRAVKRMQYRIHRQVKNTVKNTYAHAKSLPKKTAVYTKKLHKKGWDKLQKTSRRIYGRSK